MLFSLSLLIALPAHALDVQGTVWEDVNGDGELTDAVTADGVAVEAWEDGGDGLPTGADDVLVDSTTTAAGAYTLTGLADNTTHWIVVDSLGIVPSAGFNGGYGNQDAWAEQTFGAAGMACDDGSGATVQLVAAGACFGGRRGALGDDPATLADREHVARVDLVTSDQSEIDFGFSFNTVTRTGDADEDLGSNRVAQGTLRQFIVNANAISGGNILHFVPAVPTNAGAFGATFWSVPLTGDLPDVVDEATNIDGTAWCNGSSCPQGTVRDTNPGGIGSLPSVGTGPDGVPGTGDEHVIPQVPAPELELDGGDIADLDFEGLNGRVAHLAMYRTRLRAEGDFSVYEWNVIGPRADGSIPDDMDRPGIECDGDFDNSTVRNNFVQTEDFAIYREGGGGDENIIEDNELRSPPNGINNGFFSGISLRNEAGSSARQDVIRHNYIYGFSGSAMELGWNDATFDRTLVEQNTFEANGWDDQVNPTSVGGVVVRNINAGSRIDIIGNVIRDSGGPGIAIQQTAQNVTLSRNVFRDNLGPPIDLDPDADDPALNGAGDGVTPNDGSVGGALANEELDYPILTAAEAVGGSVHIEGFVGTQAAGLGLVCTIELYLADDDGDQDGEVEAGDGQSVPHGEGRMYGGSCDSANNGTFTCDIALPAGVSINVGDEVTATATDPAGNTSEFGPNFTATPGVDTDGDGLADAAEIAIGTDPNNPDTDGDGLLDGEELGTWATDPLDPDTDGDTLDDGTEALVYGTDPTSTDTDADGLSDPDELLVHGTNPLDPDTDNGGVDDGVEVQVDGTDPLDPADDGQQGVDTDGDGLSDAAEAILGTDPNNPDTDGDGLSDGNEVLWHGTDPTLADTDGGGVDDGTEVLDDGTDPLDPADDGQAGPGFDSDNDGLSNGDESSTWNTDPNDYDSDDDGLSDGEEVLVFGTDPNNPDTDGDGLLDGEEVNIHGTNPSDPDTDNGGVMDGAEVLAGTDPLDPADDYGGTGTGTGAPTGTGTGAPTGTGTGAPTGTGTGAPTGTGTGAPTGTGTGAPTGTGTGNPTGTGTGAPTGTGTGAPTGTGTGAPTGTGTGAPTGTGTGNPTGTGTGAPTGTGTGVGSGLPGTGSVGDSVPKLRAEGSCGCAQGGHAPSPGWLLLGLVLLRRRERGQARTLAP